MKKVIYFDCFAGISGDMTVGALIDLGADFAELRDKLLKLPLKGFDVSLREVKKNGIRAVKFDVHTDDSSQPCRHFSDIEKIISESDFSDNVKTRSLSIFKIIAEAEAKVHGSSPDKVHFHEVGAVDSIVDILSASFCLESLEADEVAASPVTLGRGFVQSMHGIIPVPAPATAEILKGIPVEQGDEEMELTTPTGAAIIRASASSFGKMPEGVIAATGWGAGTRDMKIPNALRVMIINADSGNRKFYELSANIDDMNPEVYSHLFARLFDAGALDVYLENLMMKKNRPGVKLSLICRSEEIRELERIIFTETTTLGLRKHAIEKVELGRNFFPVSTPWGEVNLKAAYFEGELIKAAPEYEDCRRCAEKGGVPLKDVYDFVMAAAGKENPGE